MEISAFTNKSDWAELIIDATKVSGILTSESDMHTEESALFDSDDFYTIEHLFLYSGIHII